MSVKPGSNSNRCTAGMVAVDPNRQSTFKHRFGTRSHHPFTSLSSFPGRLLKQDKLFLQPGQQLGLLRQLQLPGSRF